MHSGGHRGFTVVTIVTLFFAPIFAHHHWMWRLVGNGRITLDTNKRLPMYQSLNKKLVDESVEIGLVSVSKFFVVNKRLKNIYVAFTDFNPALRTAYIVS